MTHDLLASSCLFEARFEEPPVTLTHGFELIDQSILHIPKQPELLTLKMDPRLRALKIKTGVVKRTGKEKLSYRTEADQQKAKLDKMKAEGKDEHDVRKMDECMQESLMMIPDCHRRLEKASGELKAMIEAERADFGETEEFQEAVKILNLADEQLKAE